MIQQFAAWVGVASRSTFPSVHEFVVMNECNQPLFVNPQWDTVGPEPVGRDLRSRARGRLRRAQGASAAAIHVWGVGLSPRGNDKPNAASNSSTTPVTFLGALGAWFRAYVDEDGPYGAADGRTRLPSVPGAAVAAVRAGVRRRAVGERLEPAPDLPGLLRRRSTARRSATIGQQKGGGLPMSLNETGIQTDTVGKGGYTGTEVSATSAGGVLGRTRPRPTRRAGTSRCSIWSPATRTCAIVNIFHLIDEPSLAGWQSGLYFADHTPKQSAQIVRDWVAKTGGRCQGKLRPWRSAALTPPSTSKTKPKVSTAKNVALAVP